jgi:hypothetical protein
MQHGGRVDIVRVKVVTTPPLLADLIAVALDTPALTTWAPGDSPALVTITNAVNVDLSDTRLTIILGDRLDDPVTVVIDGEHSSRAPTAPGELRELVLDLTRGLIPAQDRAPDLSRG